MAVRRDAAMTADEITATDSDGRPLDLTIARVEAASSEYDGRIRVTIDEEDDDREWHFGVFGDEYCRRVVAEQVTDRDVPAFVERVVLQTGVDAVQDDCDEDQGA